MKSVLDLSGKWKLTYSDLRNKDVQWGRWIDALVPGDVQMALMDAHLVAEPTVSDNNEKNKWIEEKKWWYQKRFSVDPAFVKEKVFVTFEGLDTTSEIYLNGKRIGATNNMFVEYRFDISKLLRPGVNELLVGVDVGLEAVKDKPIEILGSMWNNFEKLRTWTRKSQQCYYWDGAPRILTCGIWKPVTITSFDCVRIDDVYVTSVFDDSGATLTTQIQLDTLSKNAEYQVEVTACCGGKEYRSQRQTVAGTSSEIALSVADYQLWWPNGLGEQNLYDITVTVYDAKGNAQDQYTTKHGIRTIEILREPMENDGETFTFCVNGTKIFAKGGNWVPSDALYARITAEKQEKLLELAKEANFNMIRVWGGGIYPDEAFFDACDRLGLLVWQDFMFACGYYPDFEREFMENVEDEIVKVVKRLRGHASLALWNGNNENQVMFGYDEGNGRVHYGLKIYTELIPKVLASYDRKTFYWPSSPYSGENRKFCENAGDQHCWDYTLGWRRNEGGDSLRLWNYADRDFSFLSEFGYFCPSNLSSVRKYMGEHVVSKDSEIYKFHMNHFAISYIERMLQLEYFMDPISDLQEFTLAGQMVSGEVTKHIFDELRAKMFRCSGLLFWKYNSSWGYLGYAPVDYYMSIKALYYYMKRSFEPVHIVISKNTQDLIVLNDTRTARNVKAVLKLMDFTGKVYWQKDYIAQVDASSKTIIDTGDVPTGLAPAQSGMLYAELYEDGRLIDSNRLFLSGLRVLKYPDANLYTDVEKIDDRHYKVTLMSKVFCHMVSFVTDEEYTVDDNFFDLMPHTPKTVMVETTEDLLDFQPKIYTINDLRNSHTYYSYKEEIY